eukprot:SM000214S06785  [mRNA]  locus=s214:186351:186557:+ [translate_table: standard]
MVAVEPPAPAAAEAEAAPPAGLGLRSQAAMDKIALKREEQRRRRLVQKRRLRKIGRWPPSKLAKTRNV